MNDYSIKFKIGNIVRAKHNLIDSSGGVDKPQVNRGSIGVIPSIKDKDSLVYNIQFQTHSVIHSVWQFQIEKFIEVKK